MIWKNANTILGFTMHGPRWLNDARISTFLMSQRNRWPARLAPCSHGAGDRLGGRPTQADHRRPPRGLGAFFVARPSLARPRLRAKLWLFQSVCPHVLSRLVAAPPPDQCPAGCRVSVFVNGPFSGIAIAGARDHSGNSRPYRGRTLRVGAAELR
jgi:hypothetical protein